VNCKWQAINSCDVIWGTKLQFAWRDWEKLWKTRQPVIWHRNYPFDLVEQRPWPLTGVIGAFVTITGIIKWFHQYNQELLIVGGTIIIPDLNQGTPELEPEVLTHFRSLNSACCLRLTLRPEDGGRKILRNFDELIPDYMASRPSRPYRHRENLKSNITFVVIFFVY
jgi:hypothetical protein